MDVVVVAFQSERFLAPCLNALPSRECVVVIDNNSSDATVDIGRRLGVAVVANDANRGFAAGANQGFARGTDDLVMFLNPDTVLDAGAQGALARAFADDPDLAIASPRLSFPDGRPQRASWPLPSPTGTWREALGLHRFGDRPSGAAYVVGTCMVVRRTVFEELGGFDDSYWLYGEDADLCRRALDNGWRITVVGDAIATHVGAGSSESASPIRFEHFQRGAERYIASRYGSRGLVAHRLGLLVGSLLRLPALAIVRSRKEDRVLRAAIVRRLARALVTAPGALADDSVPRHRERLG